MATKFNIVFDGVTLTKSQRDAVQADLDKLVMQHIAGIKVPKAGSWAIKVKYPKEWLGIWWRFFDKVPGRSILPSYNFKNQLANQAFVDKITIRR